MPEASISKAYERPILYDIVHGAYHLDIRVEVQAAVVVEYAEAGVVADEGVLLAAYACAVYGMALTSKFDSFHSFIS